MVDRPGAKWIDISVPLRDGMIHWPSDHPVNISRVKNMEQGGTVNLSMISMGAHSGTHVDAPIHFIHKGAGVDEVPLEHMIGRARVIEIRDTNSIKSDELTRHRIRRGERILFKTRNSPHVWQKNEFTEDFVFISDDAAQLLVERRVRVVGVDYLSVGSYRHSGTDVHKILLSGGVWIIEGLDLSRVSPGRYYLVCLPLRLVQGDGAPARAILKLISPSEPQPSESS